MDLGIVLKVEHKLLHYYEAPLANLAANLNEPLDVTLKLSPLLFCLKGCHC